jgi:hypothetical protein
MKAAKRIKIPPFFNTLAKDPSDIFDTEAYPFNTEKWLSMGKTFMGPWNHMSTVNAERIENF